jgi:osmotically-inducible protein OsmY
MKTFTQYHLLKAVMAATLLTVSSSVCAAEEVGKPSSVVKSDTTIGEKVDDTSITAQVKMALILHRSTGVLRTTVTTENGIVTIGGIAQNSAEKDLVTKLVEDVQGVKSVHNEMTIAKADTTIGEKIDDASITAKVKMALVLHRSTGALRTTVSTKDSVVTVGGKARNSAEKELVSKVVEDVQGVKSVINTMIVE